MPGNNFTKISFYIVAHADDWQLFMCPNVYNDLVTGGSKVVFIITTAGDAGVDENYWLAREEGTKSSIHFCFAPLGNFKTSEGRKEFNRHTVNYYSAGNATAYFLRLPDGNLDGSGFSSCHFQSLSKLKAGEINSIASIDGSTTYNSWADLYKTLEAIILAESNDIEEKWINYINPNTTINPNDHADHIATGHAIQCINSIKDVKQALFEGYNSGNTVNKLSNNDLFWKAGMFAAYDKAVFDNSGYSTLQEGLSTYLRWCLSSAAFITINSRVDNNS